MKQNLRFSVILLFVAVMSALAIRHEWFFWTSDGVLSPKTAVSLRLIDESEAPWVGGLAFKRSANGGYDFREGRVIHFVGSTHHTDVDMLAACIQAAECKTKQE